MSQTLTEPSSLADAASGASGDSATRHTQFECPLIFFSSFLWSFPGFLKSAMDQTRIVPSKPPETNWSPPLLTASPLTAKLLLCEKVWIGRDASAMSHRW